MFRYPANHGLTVMASQRLNVILFRGNLLAKYSRPEFAQHSRVCLLQVRNESLKPSSCSFPSRWKIETLIFFSLPLNLSEKKEPTIPRPVGVLQTSDCSSEHRQETVQEKHAPNEQDINKAITR